ncbi:MAG TPA: ATP-binding cassette domain-containing protein [Chitinophagaceae bacterium]|nr:ATP-binding cassette domain-containing protein [Chitinophagaceae bacterium]HEX5653124.1 ATP-binding cassette domain-containing protein [Chitinophagaceae bacterium]
MKISLTDAGKRFNRDWIFRHFTYSFETGFSYAITGPNGSGKSTLLQALSGSLHLNEGIITYTDGTWQAEEVPANPPLKNQPKEIPGESIYKQVSLCAPYLELVEEMTALEFLEFHQGFKPFLPGITTDSALAAVGLHKALHKQIRFFSSGMKQRIKLAQCIFSNTAIVLLDEPCTNLDAAGISLYNQLIADYCKKRLVIVSSNDHQEYAFCEKKLNITDWK